MYQLIFRTRFERVFKKLDKQTRQKIIIALELMAEDPFAFPNIRLIVSVKQQAYRLRIGRWRVLYFLISKDQVIEVVDLFMKKGHDDYQKRI